MTFGRGGYLLARDSPPRSCRPDRWSPNAGSPSACPANQTHPYGRICRSIWSERRISGVSAWHVTCYAFAEPGVRHLEGFCFTWGL